MVQNVTNPKKVNDLNHSEVHGCDVEEEEVPVISDLQLCVGFQHLHFLWEKYPPSAEGRDSTPLKLEVNQCESILS